MYLLGLIGGLFGVRIFVVQQSADRDLHDRRWRDMGRRVGIAVYGWPEPRRGLSLPELRVRIVGFRQRFDAFFVYVIGPMADRASHVIDGLRDTRRCEKRV